MSTNKSKIAVIGLGNIGKVVATNLVKGNRPVIVASRKIEEAKSFAQHVGSLATALEVSDAIKEADMVVLSVPFGTIKELVSKRAAEFKGKIIIDPSNPIAPDGNGGFKKIVGENESAGEIIAGLLPSGAKLVKAFGTLSAGSLSGAARRKLDAAVLFYAADDASVNDKIEELIKDSGFDPVRVGGIDQSIRIEVFGDLHEFGALGKVATLAEVEAKV
ncbi:NADPH-dependent F420 reductase [Chryseolinea soli]|uniref:NADP oxidoreductase coenzyme F420-dependent n=1 Tax=Chryseolinea soli TaxID=2321403 RepID=A0A385SPT1_9BACT|nr:NAD(P)-binding domain-containing protein [Chryseolinea soli]AYB31510.1 NADP oxidoreductase coenzyme F420-dependent [Chryseolinea soli]